MKSEEEVASEMAQFIGEVEVECRRRGVFLGALPLPWLIVERYWACMVTGQTLPEPASLAEGLLLGANRVDADPWFHLKIGRDVRAQYRRTDDATRSHEMDTWHEYERLRVLVGQMDSVRRARA